MSADTVFLPDANPAELSELINEVKLQSKLLMDRVIARLPREVFGVMAGLQDQGWRICLETSLDQRGQWAIVVTTTQGDRRKVVVTVATSAPSSPH